MARRSNETATFFAQKKLLGKAHTSNLLTDAGEVISTNVQLASTTVFGEAIPGNPSKSLNTGQGVGAGAKTVEYVEFALQPLNDSIYDANATGGGSGTESGESGQSSGHHAYAFKFKSTYESDTDDARGRAGNGSFDNNKQLYETLGAVQLVPFNFSGETNNPYVVQLYKDNGSGAAGDEIVLLANIDWQVDTYNGILFVQDYDANQIPAFARAFVYIGDMVDSVIAAGGGAGGTVAGSDTQVQFNDGGSAFGGDSGLVFNKTTNTLTTDNLTGSLTKLSDGTSYILSNGSITVTSQSNGSILLSAANSVFNEYIGEADGSNTRFTLDHSPTANKNVSVFVNGQLQMPATNITGAPFQDYSVTGSVIFFVTSSLPPEGSLLMANYTTNQSIS